MTIWHLPGDLIALVIAAVEARQDLYSFSLVSRFCRRSAFPLIHHTIAIENGSQIKKLIERVESENEESILLLSRVVRCLVFPPSKSINDSGEIAARVASDRFLALIPLFSGLEHLTWDIDPPENQVMFEALHAECPRLRSVKLRPYTPTKQMYCFRNLSHIDVRVVFVGKTSFSLIAIAEDMHARKHP